MFSGDLSVDRRQRKTSASVGADLCQDILYLWKMFQ